MLFRSKARIGPFVTLANVREINARVVAAILRDLVPATNGTDEKNEDAPEVEKAE